MGNQACCNANEANAQSEITENTKEPTIGTVDIPGQDVSAPAAAGGAGAAAPETTPKAEQAPVASSPPEAVAETLLSKDEYTVTIDKSSGDKMGIDVDHKDGATLLIEMVNEGLVKSWNDNPDNKDKVSLGDRIVEVNGIRSDVLQLVDECKKNQVLNLKIRRGS
eukprot:TRINITY_DN2440_c0_g1_i1.p1 TRINITY_DN2440_c0_g1~~TRINITY_DN2440_c0_g1_i1.p1  ORF type:complete len:193 (+),score=45.03 TRINITY_DN2440_c0_g1_i1:86-580(+)